MENHLHVLRMDTSGGSSSIQIRNWTSGSSEVCGLSSNMITNADTGIVITFDTQYGASTAPYIATVSGGTVSASPIPSGLYLIPELQGQDGSFVGTAYDNDGQEYMVAFEQSGAIHWSITDEYPVMATEDGGVVSASGTLYASDGNVIGLAANPGVQSWLGYSYSVGSVIEWMRRAMKAAQSWWPFQRGNASGNRAAVQHPPYAQLDSCNDSTLHPPPACPGPKDAVFTAWYWLKQRINEPARAPYLDQYIFLDLSGNTRRSFSAYLNVGPEFYDGPRSMVRMTDAQCWRYTSDDSVHDYFHTSNSGALCTVAAVSCRFDLRKPVRTFFEPRAISLENQGATDGNIALEFHEALHGFKAYDDPQLQGYLGCSNLSDTRNITIYLQQFVSAQAPQGVPMTCEYIENHRMPSTLNVCVR